MIVTNEMLTRYHNLVENNSHGEALEQVARDFKLSHYANIFRSINNIHNLEGHLNFDVLTLRDRIKKEMFYYLFNALSNKDYAAIKGII